MKKIVLDNVLPHVFQDGRPIYSDVWNSQVSLERGKLYLVEAASGTGKSSMLSYIYGYRIDYSGTIHFDDRELKSYTVEDWVQLRQRGISILFQELRLFPELTAWENIIIQNQLTNYKTDDEIHAYFEALGIGDKETQLCGKLSFGQQQRVAMIRSLCQPFDFVFLDEPISHLDEVNSGIMGRLVVEEAKRQGAAIIVTSIGKHIDLPYDHIFKL